MRRRTLILAATGGSVLGAAALGILLGPRLVEHEIEARLRARLEDRGVHATWGTFAANGVRSFQIDDLHVEIPRMGAVLDSDRVVVDVGIGSIWSGEIRLTEVSLSPARLQIDVEKILDAGDDASDDADTGATGRGGSGLVKRLLANPPVVNLTDAELLLTRGDSDLLRVSSPKIAVDESWGEFTVAFDGDVQVLADEVPALLKERLPWRFEGAMTPKKGNFSYRVAAPAEGTPLLRVDLPEVLSVEVASVSGEGQLTDRTAAINLENLELVVGGEEYAALHAKAPRALLSRQKSGRPRIEVIDPAVYVAPSQRKKIRDAVRTLRSAGDDATAKEPAAPGTADRKGSSAFSRLSRLATRTDVELTGLSVGLHLEGEDGAISTITLLERLDTSIRDGLVRARGSTAGGQFFAEAEVYPGQSWPHYLVVRADDVHVEKIPGMARERSQLPSRGTSGTVAGIVDLDLALTMPSQGMDGPLLQSPGIGEARFRWSEGMLDLSGVADVPLTDIETTAVLAFTMRPELAWVELEGGHVTYGPARVDFTGRVTDFPLDTELEMEGGLEEIECQTMFRSLPTALLGPYANVELEGKWAPRGWLRFPLYRPLGLRMKIEEESFADLCRVSALNAAEEAWPEVTFVSSAPTGPHQAANTPLPPIILPGPDGERPRNPEPRKPKRSTSLEGVEWLNSPFIKRITEGLSDLEQVEIHVGPGTSEYVPLEELPAWVGGAAFLSEEMDFYEDGPISLSLMKKAMRVNLQKGRFVYGGSTVTQQLVKNLFLTREKTLARKLQEALVAWRITDAVSKDRVLELYLNCIEFGKDVYGIGPAARHYFQKDARYLTPKEAVFLAMLKPAPLFGEKIMARGTTPKGTYWTNRIVELHQRLVDYEFITPAQMKAQEPYELEWEDGRYKSAPMLFVPMLD